MDEGAGEASAPSAHVEPEGLRVGPAHANADGGKAQALMGGHPMAAVEPPELPIHLQLYTRSKERVLTVDGVRPTTSRPLLARPCCVGADMFASLPRAHPRASRTGAGHPAVRGGC